MNRMTHNFVFSAWSQWTYFLDQCQIAAYGLQERLAQASETVQMLCNRLDQRVILAAWNQWYSFYIAEKKRMAQLMIKALNHIYHLTVSSGYNSWVVFLRLSRTHERERAMATVCWAFDRIRSSKCYAAWRKWTELLNERKRRHMTERQALITSGVLLVYDVVLPMGYIEGMGFIEVTPSHTGGIAAESCGGAMLRVLDSGIYGHHEKAADQHVQLLKYAHLQGMQALGEASLAHDDDRRLGTERKASSSDDGLETRSRAVHNDATPLGHLVITINRESVVGFSFDEIVSMLESATAPTTVLLGAPLPNSLFREHIRLRNIHPPPEHHPRASMRRGKATTGGNTSRGMPASPPVPNRQNVQIYPPSPQPTSAAMPWLWGVTWVSVGSTNKFGSQRPVIQGLPTEVGLMLYPADSCQDYGLHMISIQAGASVGLWLWESIESCGHTVDHSGPDDTEELQLRLHGQQGIAQHNSEIIPICLTVAHM